MLLPIAALEIEAPSRVFVGDEAEVSWVRNDLLNDPIRLRLQLRAGNSLIGESVSVAAGVRGTQVMRFPQIGSVEPPILLGS